MDLLDRPNRPPEPVDRRPHGGAAASVDVIVHVVGEIDICTEPALIRCLAAQLQLARHLTSLVVDLSSATYIGVRGVAALLAAAADAQHRDVTFSLAECSPQVLRLLAVLDPDHTLTVRADPGRAGRPRSSDCTTTPPQLGEIRSLPGEAVIAPRPDTMSSTVQRETSDGVGSAAGRNGCPA
jgi:anti-anti-sigma factor